MKILDDFIRSYFSKEANILIFGSFIKIFNIKSDIDILIVSHTAGMFIKEQYLFRGVTFDVIIIPASDVLLCMEKDRELNVYCDIFNSGYIYKDASGLIEYIRNNYCAPSSGEEIYLKKNNALFKIEKTYKLLMHSKSIYEADLHLSDLIKILLEARLLDFRISNVSSIKYLYKFIESHDRQLLTGLYKAKKKFLGTQDFNFLKDDLSKFMPKVLRGAHSNQYVLNAIYDGEVVVFLKSGSVYIERVEDFLVGGAYYYYRFSVDANNVLPHGDYLVVKGEKDRLENNFINGLYQIIKENGGRRYNNELVFPFQFSVRRSLGINDSLEMSRIDDMFRYANLLKTRIVAAHRAEFIYDFFKLLFEESLVSGLYEKLVDLEKGFLNKSASNALSVRYQDSERALLMLKHRIDSDFNEISLEVTSDKNIFSTKVPSVGALVNFFNYYCNFILNKDPRTLYSIINMLFNIFGIGDFKKAYIFYLLTKK